MISFVPGYYGHLGNQMFQYAATRSLAAEANRSGDGLRPAVGWPGDKRPNLYDIFTNLEGDRRQIRTELNYAEKHFHFDPEFFSLPDGVQLSGYFQSWKYFSNIPGQIAYEFSLPTDDWSRGSVSVHVRRGDYLSFPDHHPPLTVDYYREAMGHFPGADFVVFSDDPGWCLLNLKPLGNVEIVTGGSAVEDLTRMIACYGGHIIANSSFSWWGAWLDPNPHKKVIAPMKWFGPAKADWNTKDLIPDGWERI
jgi:hypothetical protein